MLLYFWQKNDDKNELMIVIADNYFFKTLREY